VAKDSIRRLPHSDILEHPAGLDPNAYARSNLTICWGLLVESDVRGVELGTVGCVRPVKPPLVMATRKVAGSRAILVSWISFADSMAVKDLVI
jgi:hypothetical protein